MNLNLRTHLIAATLISLVACGGGSSGGGSSVDMVVFQGTLRGDFTNEDQSGDPRGVIPDTTICALSQCATTNNSGYWRFQLPKSQNSGGTVIFDINGPLAQGTVAVPDVNFAANNIIVDFLRRSNGEIFTSEFEQDGAKPLPATQPNIENA